MAEKKQPPLTKKESKAVSKKVGTIIKEGYPPKQAVAIAISKVRSQKKK